MSWAPFALAAVGALGSLSQSSQAAENADFNAEVARNNAAQERLFAEEDAARQRTEGIRQTGKTRAKVGAAGIDVGSGSILDVITDDAIQNELAALDITARAETKARSFESQGSIFSREASNTRKNAPLSALGAGLQGFAAGKSLN